MGRKQGKAGQQERKEKRAKDTLKDKMVSSGMLECYKRSAAIFLDFAKDHAYQVNEWDQLDEVVSQWVEHIYHDGHHKSLASDGLAGIQSLSPGLWGD